MKVQLAFSFSRGAGINISTLTRNVIFIALFIASLSGCTPVLYKITNIDQDVFELANEEYLGGCVPEFNIEWSDGVKPGIHNSYSLSGNRVEYVEVNLRQVLLAVNSELASHTKDRLCEEKKQLLVSRAKLITHVSPETGIHYAKAKIRLTANTICGDSDRTVSGTFEYNSPAIRVGFFVNNSEIEYSLEKATTYAAIGVIREIIGACNAPSSSWNP